MNWKTSTLSSNPELHGNGTQIRRVHVIHVCTAYYCDSREYATSLEQTRCGRDCSSCYHQRFCLFFLSCSPFPTGGPSSGYRVQFCAFCALCLLRPQSWCSLVAPKQQGSGNADSIVDSFQFVRHETAGDLREGAFDCLPNWL